MSKTSSKNRYTQLMEWREAMNINVGKRRGKRMGKPKQSRMEYMNSKGRQNSTPNIASYTRG